MARKMISVVFAALIMIAPSVLAQENYKPSPREVKAWRKSAKQGDDKAQFNLGLMYAYGQSSPKNYVEALKWYRKSAEQGNSDAQNNLGLIYANGRGVPKDYVEAVKWLRKAAEQGNSGVKTASASCITKAMVCKGIT